MSSICDAVWKSNNVSIRDVSHTCTRATGSYRNARLLPGCPPVQKFSNGRHPCGDAIQEDSEKEACSCRIWSFEGIRG